MSQPIDRGRLPAAALFDMDGTLVDSESMMGRALVRTMTAAGAAPEEVEVLATTLGRSWVDVHAELQVWERTGWSVHEMVDRVIEDALEAGEVAETLTGAVDLVHALAEAGVPVGVVSGSLRGEVNATVARLGIAHLLACAHGAEDYPRGKPDPSGYLGAAALLGVDPARCVVFEDSVVGVRAALAAGMVVVANAETNQPPGTPGHQDVSDAHLVVDHLGLVTVETLTALLPHR
jgi:sugar-phosphatase